ncbi:ribokinase [Sodalis sp. RH21]|uniref:ribokinase n=1 Tax=unclassified Sodalis (in: enterobacteria) TaxID=2636512 RepID=UPI0039B39108
MFKKNIVVLGSVNQDHIIRSHHLPCPGETVVGHQHILVNGGKGANQAVAAARLGSQVTFATCVGDDPFAHSAIAAFKADGINIDSIEVCKNENTGIAFILVDDNGQNCIAICANANARLTKAVVDRHAEKIKHADFLLLQLETPMAGIEQAILLARQQNGYVILNPAPAQPLTDRLLSQIDLITPNESEAEILTGIKVVDEITAGQAARYFVQKGVKSVIITLGSRGAYLYQDNQGRLIPGYRVKAADTTAAGDTFNGALVVALSEGETLEQAILFAHKASAISVTRLGAQTSIPYRQELATFDFNPEI